MLDLVGPVTLRPFALTDASAVEPWLSAPGLSVPAGRASREWPQRLLADSRIAAGIAETQGHRIGFVRLDCGPDHVAEITLVIAPEYRRRGHGRWIFEAALREASRRDVHHLVAMVGLDNDPALQFFAELGFEPEGQCGDRLRLTRIVHDGSCQVPLEI